MYLFLIFVLIIIVAFFSYTIYNSSYRKSPGLALDEKLASKYGDFAYETPYGNRPLFVNLDFFYPKKYQINSNSVLLCKTMQAFNILRNYYGNTHIILYSGFTSRDVYDSKIPKNYRKFIHVVGKSPFKGTIPLVRTWKEHPEWPTLTIIANDQMGVATKVKDIINTNSNINLVTTFLDDKKLSEYINLHGIHLCTSEHEGYGHYIHEAQSAKSVVLYTDAPCMNDDMENTGIPVYAEFVGYKPDTLCPRFMVTKEGIENAVTTALSLPVEMLKDMGEKARDKFLQEKRLFADRITSHVNSLN